MSYAPIFYCLQQPYPDEKYLVYGRPEWNKEFGKATWADEVGLESIQCPVYPGHRRGEKRIGDLVIVLPSWRVGDFTWTWLSDCLITEKILRLFQEANFTGFTVKPVRVKPRTEKGKKLTTIPTLWELIITGQGGDADSRSGIRLIYSCPHCGLTEYSSFQNGIIVDEQVWDGSDFFTVTGYPKFILVTERVKNLVIKYNLTNCALIPSYDLTWGSVLRPEDMYSSPDTNR